MRMAGQEKAFRLTADTAQITFELSAARCRSSGRVYDLSLQRKDRWRGEASPPARLPKSLSFDRAVAHAGQKTKALIRDMGRGELTSPVPASLPRQMAVDTGAFDLALPKDLPTGIYPVLWSLHTLDGNTREGEELVGRQRLHHDHSGGDRPEAV